MGRLGDAVTRLESAASNLQTAAPSAADTKPLEEKLARLSRDHGALKETAGRVAARLDAAIGRLSASLKD